MNSNEKELELLKEKYKEFFTYLDEIQLRKKNNAPNNIYLKKNKIYEYESKDHLLIINDDMIFRNVYTKNNINILFPDNVRFKGNVELGTGYNFSFGKKTIIEKSLVANGLNKLPNREPIRIKTLGDELRVQYSIDLLEVELGKYPNYLSSHSLYLDSVKGPKSFGSKTEIFYKLTIIGNSKSLKNLGDNFLFKGSEVLIIGSSITKIPESFLSQNISPFEIKFFIGNPKKSKKNKSIYLPVNFKDKKIKLLLKNILVENLYDFKKIKNLNITIVDNSSEINIEDYEGKNLNDFFHSIHKLNPNDTVFFNLLSYNAPNKLWNKLLFNDINNINSEDINYFHENKRHLEKYIKYDQDNIIFYCRSKEAFEFLFKNNYQFNDKEYIQIKKESIKPLYGNFFLKTYLKSHQKNTNTTNNALKK